MTINALLALAEYHERTAANQFELAKTMVGSTADNFRSLGAQHQQWAEQLRQLAAAFQTFGEALKS